MQRAMSAWTARTLTRGCVSRHRTEGEDVSQYERVQQHEEAYDILSHDPDLLFLQLVLRLPRSIPVDVCVCVCVCVWLCVCVCVCARLHSKASGTKSA